VLVDIKAWPGNISVFSKVGATASLDIHCARARIKKAKEAGDKTGDYSAMKTLRDDKVTAWTPMKNEAKRSYSG
jgi:hypothetical protein